MASALPESTVARAACLTPPAVGGIAVVQVVGESALDALSRHLRKSGQPVDLRQLSPTELRLCRLIDQGDDVLDDVLVS